MYAFVPGTARMPFPQNPAPAKVVKRQFTHEEDNILRKAVAEYGLSNWDRIASVLNGRTPRQCRDRWNKYLSPDLRDVMWTDAEDQRLLGLVEQLGPKWARLRVYFPGRSDINIKNRYKYLVAKGVTLSSTPGDLGISPPPPPPQTETVGDVYISLETRQLSKDVIEQAQRYNQRTIAALDRLFQSLGPIRPHPTSQITTKM